MKKSLTPGNYRTHCFVAKFYTYHYKKYELIEWLVENGFATEKELANKSLPFIHSQYPQQSEELLDEKLKERGYKTR